MNIKDWYERAKKEGYYGVGKGWSEILNDLCDKLIAIDDSIEVLQVKEKYGLLRYYIGGVESGKFDKIHRLIDKAENESSKTCEECGSKDNVETKGGWLLTLCDKCRKNRK